MATVPMVLVISSVLEAVGFDPDRSELHVRFRNGGTYVYSDVPERVFRELLEAGSKGGFLANVIKPGYDGREL
jgi:predicted DCC family thiol-disulfide oxidoreductase YuxK